MKKKRKKKREGVWSGFLVLILGLAILILAFLLLFHIQKIEVTGNSYTSEIEVVNWLKKDKYTSNSVYVWWKYRHTQMKDLPLVEGADITLKNPWTIRIRVYEKSIIGYLELNGKYIYFDKDGVVALIADLESVDGVPKIEGINLTTADVKAHKALPVDDTEIFDSVLTVTSEVKKQELSPDRIVFDGKEATLYFGQVTVLLGSGKLDVKIAQIQPILEKLSEKYTEVKGTLHLENYSGSGAAISFVPDKEENTEDSENESEDSDSYDSAEEDSDYDSDYDSNYDSDYDSDYGSDYDSDYE